MNNERLPAGTERKNEDATVVLWTHPRSVSTAFARCFSDRPDCVTVHEPLARVAHYDLINARDPDGRSREQATNEALETYRTPVPGKFRFIKDMAYYVRGRIDLSLLRDCRHTFLVRRPEDALLSHYRKYPKMTEEETGYEALLWLFEHFRKEKSGRPVVIEGNDFRREPEKVLRSYCAALGIPFSSETLHWSPDDRPEWNIWRTGEADWHAEIAASSGIEKPPERLAQEEDLPEEIRKMLPACRRAYEAILAEGERM